MDQLIQWIESFAVGHQGLDAEHRRLVELINKICAIHCEKNTEQLAILLSAFREAVQGHFRHEKSILWEIKSGIYEPLKPRTQTMYSLKAMAEAAFDALISEHDMRLTQLDAIVEGSVDAFCDGLVAWFVDHVHKNDANLTAIFQAAR